MNVTVRFMGLVRHYAGRDEAAVELPEGATVADLVDALTGDLAILSTVDGITFMIGGKTVSMATALAEGDRVLALQSLGGG
jgi:molybdopterin converting factor small subunit